MPDGDPIPSLAGGRQHEGRLRIRIIYNPRTGRKRQVRFNSVLACLEADGHELDVLTTGAAGDAARFARETDTANADVLAVAGGDGTLNDAIQGYGPQSPPLGLIPLGTANVLAHELGIGTDPHQIAACLTGGHDRPIRPGLVNGHRFLMMAGVGLDAQVVSDLRRSVKSRFGRAAYFIEVVRTLRRWRCPPLTFRADGTSGQAATLIVSRGRHYGGPFVLAPEGDLSRDVMHLTRFPCNGALSVFGRFLLIPTGRLYRTSLVDQSATREVAILEPAGDPVQADGDVVTALPARFSLADLSIRICVPAPRD